MRAAVHASRDPSRLLERIHCLAEMVERRAVVLVERLLPPGPAHAGAAAALGLMLLAEAGLFIKRCDDEAMRRKAD